MQKGSETLLLVGGGLVLLYLMTRNSATANAQTAALNAGLTSQQIAANAANNKTAAIVGGVTSLVGTAASALSSGNSGSAGYTQYANYTS